MCLDFRAFRPARSEVESFGCRPKVYGNTCDIEHSRECIGRSSAYHPTWLQDRLRRIRDAERLHERLHNQQVLIYQHGQPNQQSQTHQQNLTNQQGQSNQQAQNGQVDHSAGQVPNPGEPDEQDQLDIDEDEDQGSQDQDQDQDQHQDQHQDQDQDRDQNDSYSYEGEMSPTSVQSDDLLDPDQTSTAHADSLLHGGDFRRLSGLIGITPVSPREQHHGHDLVLPERVPFLILWASDHNLALFSPRFDQTATIMINALQQRIPMSAGDLERFDRLNMSAQIPELGIVIIASQIGRVAVLSLTRRKRAKRPNYCAFRVDWFLPFKSQEDNLQRPMLYPLLGIAVGPIQGQQAKPKTLGDDTPDGFASRASRAGNSSRRYRLMLTYSDQTVLSYELGRSGDGGDGAEVLIF